LVQVLDDPAIPTPIALGVVYSETTTWAAAVKNYERPIPPQLESPGSTGTLYNYNAIYGTYVPTYEPTDSAAGVWYDRFIKFPVGYFVRDKRSLPAYNPWYKTALEEKKTGVADILLNIVEDWSCLYRPEKFFYLERNRMPFRPDPVFDTTSETHPSIATEPVIKSKAGIGFFDNRTSKDWTDKFPMPLSVQSVPDSSLSTAYDEIINASLEELRRNNKNVDNAELPLEPRVVQEIKIGRNKLVISDIYGDGTSVFITLKNEHDAGISIVYSEFTECEEVKKDCQTYKEGSAEYVKDIPDGKGTRTITGTYDSANTNCDGKKISQVRIRGPLGEALLLESYGTSPTDSYSRIVARGIGGQLFELYDDLETGSNYIYGLSTNTGGGAENWSMTTGSFFLAGIGALPSFLRLTNNPLLGDVSSTDAYYISGAFTDTEQIYTSQYASGGAAYRHEYVKAGKIYDRLLTATSTGITDVLDYDGKISISIDTEIPEYVLTVTDGTNSSITVTNEQITLKSEKILLDSSNILLGTGATLGVEYGGSSTTSGTVKVSP